MMIVDKDLQSVQEVRRFLEEAKQAQTSLGKMSQSQIDEIVQSMATEARQEAERLAAIAVEETGFGNIADKLTKNLFAANDVFHSIKDLKTVGIIQRDEQKQVWEVAEPVGIVAGIIPSTNPTSTTIFKALIALKSRNALVLSPHPAAARCTVETAQVMQRAAERAGAPAGAITCLTQPTMAAVQELMTHKLTDVILATGGTSMIKAAYSSGKPAFGVGPGNVPAYIHSSANVRNAVAQIMHSKTFDHGTICASEQALVVDQEIKRVVVSELKQRGAYFLDDHEKSRVASTIMVNGVLNTKIVGKSAQEIAEIAGIIIPGQTRVLMAEESEIGKVYPFSIEKLAPILALYTVQDWQEASHLCQQLLELGGLGHTLGIHCQEEHIIEAFSLVQPVSRIVVNSGTTFGGIGATTGVVPSLTLGCGSYGNNVTTDNIGPQHLLNIKRVAFAIREMKEAEQPLGTTGKSGSATSYTISREEIMEIVKSLLTEMKV